ncbi:hypothetical protein [Mycetocola sp. 2940]|uniref:hypothetical protein n=1 Tax=Mycetocola sp. 2940 TaxID=3156452 RepID=UPI003392061C
MGWKEFAASVIGDVLSWPIVVLVVVLLLLKPIRRLIGRVKAAMGFGGELEFSELLEVAEENVDEVLESEPIVDHSEPATDEPKDSVPGAGWNSSEDQDGPDPDPHKPDPTRDPSGAIIMSWQTLMKSLEDFGRLKAGRGRPTRNPRLIIEQLRRSQAVSEAFYESAISLLELRNQVAHGEAVPTKGAARTYVVRAHQLEMVVRGMIGVEMMDLDVPAESDLRR